MAVYDPFCGYSRYVHSLKASKVRKQTQSLWKGYEAMAGRSVCMLLLVAALTITGCAKAFALDSDANQSQPVNGEEIAALLQGKVITPSMRYQQAAPPAGEWFGIDHRWQASLQSFSLKQIRGTWDVEGNSICVLPADKPKFCRTIWRNSKSGEISITMVPGWSWTAKPIVVDVVARTWGLAR